MLGLRMVRAAELRSDAISKIAEIERQHPTAEHQGKTECCRSGVCCWRRPGALAEEDIAPLALHLGITEQELFRDYLVVDEIQGRRCLLPRRAHQEGGSMIGWEETYSVTTPCVFLDETHDNACKAHEAKPAACRNFKCWEGENSTLPPISDERLRALGWDFVNPDDSE